MCSKTVVILRKKRFDFTQLATSATSTIILAPAIDVSAHYRIHLLVRLHSSGMSSGQLVTFEIDHTLPSEEDPAEFIERDATGSALATLDVDSSDSAPTLISTTAVDLQAAVRIQMIATQATSGTAFPFEMSALAVLRNF